MAFLDGGCMHATCATGIETDGDLTMSSPRAIHSSVIDRSGLFPYVAPFLANHVLDAKPLDLIRDAWDTTFRVGVTAGSQRRQLRPNNE
jgi:hypothetical protein